MNQVLELGDSDPFSRIDFKDPAKNQVQFWREREDGLQETCILEVSSEGAVALRSTLPWITSTGKVDEDNTE